MSWMGWSGRSQGLGLDPHGLFPCPWHAGPQQWLGTEGFTASRGGDGTSQCLSSPKSLNPPGLRLIIPPTLSRGSSGRRGSVHLRVPPGQLPRVDPSLSSIFPLSPHLFLSLLWSFLCGAQWGPSPSSRIVSKRRGFWKE